MKPLLCLILLMQIPGQPVPRGSITGIVVRAGTNEPLPLARVELTVAEIGGLSSFDNPLIQTMARSRRSSPSTTTDAEGRFTFKDVEPDHYIVAAIRDGFVRREYGQRGFNESGAVVEVRPGESVEDIVIGMFPAPTIYGAITDPEGEPLAGVSVQAHRMQRGPHGRIRIMVQAAETDDRGAYRLFWLTPGDYYVTATYGPDALFPVVAGVPQRGNLPEPDDGFATLYYPGTPNESDATAIRLSAGTDIGGVNIRLLDISRYTVKGRVIDALTGKPPAAVSQPFAVQMAFRPKSNTSNFAYRHRPNAQGEFEIPGVTPGSYLLNAIQTRGTRASSLTIPVEVAGQDVENLVVPIFPSKEIRGRILTEIGGAFSDSIDHSGTIPGLVPAGGVRGPGGAGRANSDGTFVMSDVAVGEYEFRMLLMPGGFYLKNVRIGGTDLLASGLSVGNDFNGFLEVVISDGAGTVEGSVVDADNKPIQCIVVLIPETQFRYRQDRYRIRGTDRSGRFRIRSVAPGEYSVLAFEEIEPGAYYDSDFLQRFQTRVITVRVAEGGSASVQVKVIPAVETSGGGR